MDRDLKTFRDLVLWLFDSHEKPWEYSHEGARKIYLDRLGSMNPISGREELETFLPTGDKVQAEFRLNQYLYLNPIEKGGVFVPRINIKCDFGRNHPMVRLRLGLFLTTEDSLEGFGFRFETPEGRSLERLGRHHYYHAQIIQDFGHPERNKLIGWLPDEQPAFPLDANDPVKLLISLLVSLYGLDYLGYIRNVAPIQHLRKYTDEMFCIDLEPTEFYWMVSGTNPPRDIEGYRTLVEINEFTEFIRRKYPGCRIRGLTKTAYHNLPEGKQLVYSPDQ